MLKRVVVNLVREQPFYAHILNQLQVIEDPQIAIAGCSISGGKIYLHLNSPVFKQLTLENQTVIIIHELLHLIGRHTTRIGNRQKIIWNIACDAAVNQYISGIPIKQKVVFKVPAPQGGFVSEEREVGGVTLDNIVLPNGNKVVLPPGGFAEQYYNLLLKQAEGCQATGGNPGEGNMEGSGSANQASVVNDPADLHPTWGQDNSSCQDIDEAVLSRVVEKAAQKCQGNLPGHVQELVDRLLKSQTPWRRILQLYLARQASEQKFTTFRKLNRRLSQYELPGLKRERKLNLVVAIDTSGSIGNAELAGFAAEVERIRRCGAEVTLLECDCKIQRVYPLKRKIDLSFQGRGGTDFRPVWEYIKSKGLRPDAVIYLTDGRGQAPSGSMVPTLWALTPDGVLPWMSTAGKIRDINWGKVIRLNLG